MKKLQQFVLPLASAPLLMAVGMGSASAQSVTNAFIPGVQQWSDDSAEILVDNGTTVGSIDVGDYLVGMFGITSFPTSGVAANSVNELTAVFALQVTGVAALPAAACGNAALTSCAAFTFSAPAVGLNAAVDAVPGLPNPGLTNPNGSALSPNATVVFLEDAVHNYNRTSGTLAGSFATGSGGNEMMVAGFGTVGDNWQGTAPQVQAQLGLIAPGANAGTFGIQQTVLAQGFPGWTFALPILGTGNISAPTAGSPWPIFNDTTITVTALVPEPATLALVSLGLLGLGAKLRRRKA